MKKTVLLMALLGLSYISEAQNTFPTTGNVGIGTTSPSEKLEIKGVISIGEPSGLFPFKIWAGGSGSLNHMRIGTDYGHTGDAVLELYQNYNGGSQQNPGKLIVNGNLGVGTLNPSYKLSVLGDFGVNYGNSIYLGGATGDTVIGRIFNDAGVYTIQTDSTRDINLGSSTHSDAFFIEGTNGNVGVGTVTPSEKLDVDGVVKGKSAIKIAANGTTGYVGSGLYLNSHHNYRGAGIFSLGQTNNWFIGNPYTDHAGSFMIGVAPKPQLGESIDIVAQKEYAKFYINQNGNVGIGTVTPTESFEIFDSVNAPGVISLKSGRNDASYVDVGRLSAKQGVTEVARIGMPRAGGTYTGLITFWTKPTNTSGLVESMRINENGNVGIGTTNPDVKLAVNGKIHTKEVKVDLVGWPDYVFAKEYKLRTIEEVERHIKEKGYLPNMPSAKEVEKNGVLLGEMNKKLLEKIEELTLYTIAQEKKIKEQEGKITKQQKEINSLNKISERIKIIEDLLKNNK